MLRAATLSFVAVLTLTAPAAAAAPEITRDGLITAVTVFRDRAEVVRTVELALPAGQSTVVVPGLPAGLIADSVRVRGAAAGDLLIRSVETRQRFTEDLVHVEERRLTAEIEALQDRRRALDDRVQASRIQLAFVQALGHKVPQIASQNLVEGQLDPEAWQKTLSLVGEGAAKALDEIRTAEIEKRAVDRQIAQIQQRLNQVRTGRSATLEARINVAADAPAEARLELVYQLAGASWRPLYDARLDSETGKTQLVQIGEVRQRTGEDWSNVRLTLSTALAGRSARLPELGTWFVDFLTAQQLGGSFSDLSNRELLALSELNKLNEGLGESLYAADAASKSAAAGEPVAQSAAVSLTAQVAVGEFAAQYLIPGETDVPADNRPHKFVIAEHEFEARLAVRTVPKVSPQAYLFGEITYDGDDPLLPGPVAVFRDEAFVGTSAIGLLRPDETFKLSFGVDEKVRVAYRLETGERSRQGLISKDQRVERRWLIEIANFHRRPIQVAVLDQLPVPRDERIEVELLDDTTEPTETDVEDRKGVLAWTYDYEAGEERTIRFGYAITFPEGQSVVGF